MNDAKKSCQSKRWIDISGRKLSEGFHYYLQSKQNIIDISRSFCNFATIFVNVIRGIRNTSILGTTRVPLL